MDMMTSNLSATWPSQLSEADFTRLRFALDFISPCTVEPATFLGLRKALRLATSKGLAGHEGGARERLEALFDPLLSEDPVAVRKHQKPAPPFVLSPVVTESVELEAGDRLCVDVLFLGTGVTLIHDFLSGLIALGHLGLVRGDGRFDVTEVWSLGLDEQAVHVWRQKDETSSLTSHVLSAEQWLEESLPDSNEWSLEFLTPARLLVDGKPLRAPRFEQVFPFMLRRVSSMLHAHCHIESFEQVEGLLDAAREVTARSHEIRWQDWRSIGSHEHSTIGGFVGYYDLNGRALDSIAWVVALASLLGVGKGAAFGAGSFQISG